MFHARYDKYEAAFTFRHTRGCDFQVKSNKLITDVTSCFLTINKEQFEGVAACVAGDSFCKEIGRKHALTRALKEAQVPKELRTAVWDAYFMRGYRPEGN